MEKYILEELNGKPCVWLNIYSYHNNIEVSLYFAKEFFQNLCADNCQRNYKINGTSSIDITINTVLAMERKKELFISGKHLFKSSFFTMPYNGLPEHIKINTISKMYGIIGNIILDKELYRHQSWVNQGTKKDLKKVSDELSYKQKKSINYVKTNLSKPFRGGGVSPR